MTDIPFFSEKKPHKGDKLTFVLIFIPSFALLFPLALLGQLVGLHWKHWLPGAEKMTNIYSGVKAAVYTFMSHII